MAALSSVSSVVSSAASQFLRPGALNATANQSPAAAALSEANETLAVTRAEAAKGDQTAIRKLRAIQQAQETKAAATTKTDSAGAQGGTAKTLSAATEQAATPVYTANASRIDTQA